MISCLVGCQVLKIPVVLCCHLGTAQFKDVRTNKVVGCKVTPKWKRTRIWDISPTRIFSIDTGVDAILNYNLSKLVDPLWASSWFDAPTLSVKVQNHHASRVNFRPYSHRTRTLLLGKWEQDIFASGNSLGVNDAIEINVFLSKRCFLSWCEWCNWNQCIPFQALLFE